MSTPTKELTDVLGTLPIISGTNADMLDGVHDGNVTARYLNNNGVAVSLGDISKMGLYNIQEATLDKPYPYGSILHLANTNQKPGAMGVWAYQLSFDTGGNVYYRNITNAGNWINWKTIAFTNSAVAGLVPKQLTNEDLNNIKDINFTVYQAPYNNTVKNKPAGVNGFALRVQRISGDSFLQTLIFCETTPKVFMRSFIPSSGWCAWRQLALV